MYRISDDKEAAIQKMLAEGKTKREIADEVGVATMTVLRRAKPIDGGPLPRVRTGDDRCDFCGGVLGKGKEFHRRTRRTSHKFCSSACYQKFYRAKRANEACKGCGLRRKDFVRVTFVQGYCPQCYGILKQYGFDEGALVVHRLTRQLKQELRNGKRAID